MFMHHKHTDTRTTAALWDAHACVAARRARRKNTDMRQLYCYCIEQFLPAFAV